MVLKYRDAEDRPPKPCHKTMDAQTIEREKLYAKVEPPGAPIPINVEPFDINDATPTEVEIGAVMKGLKMDKQAVSLVSKPNT